MCTAETDREYLVWKLMGCEEEDEANVVLYTIPFLFPNLSLISPPFWVFYCPFLWSLFLHSVGRFLSACSGKSSFILAIPAAADSSAASLVCMLECSPSTHSVCLLIPELMAYLSTVPFCHVLFLRRSNLSLFFLCICQSLHFSLLSPLYPSPVLEEFLGPKD